MFEKILVPLDRSALAERVLPHTVALAGVFHSRVSLLHVLDPVHMTTYARSVDAFDWQMNRAEAEKYLEGIVQRLAQAGVKADCAILEGQAADRLMEHARAIRADLIVLSSHGQSGLSDWNISSVVQRIILRAYTSIMIVRANQPGPTEITGLRYHRLLLPMDGSQRAECVLPPAEMLARAHEAQALFAHVVRGPEMPRRTPLSPEDAELAERIVVRNQEEATRYLNDLASRLPGSAESRLIVRASVDAALHDLADQEKVDLVILSAHGYTGETRWPYGGVVNSFLSYGNTPLLIVHDVPESGPQPAETEATRSIGRP